MILFVSLLIILAIVSTKLSARFGLPLLLGFILIGIIVGSDVLNLFYFDNTDLAKRLADVLLMFIIFEGGFRVSKEEFTQVSGPSLTLATLGVALTAAILGLLVHWILHFEIVYSMLLASIISSTDASALFMINKENPIKRKLGLTLNVESAANDPMAIILTLTFIQIATGAFKSPLIAVPLFIWQFAGGIIIAFILKKATTFMFRRLNSDNRGNYNVLMLGCILLAYGLSELLQANGIITVFFMGYWLGNVQFPAKRSVSNFLESITTIFNMVIFIMLGLLSFPHRFVFIWKEALLVVIIMMFIARPLAVLLSTIPFKYSVKEKTFLMWGGVKGTVAIVLATYPMASGLDENGFIFDVIFFAVFVSCILQGATMGPLARLMKLTERRKPESPHIVELHSTKCSDLDMFEVELVSGSNAADRSLASLGFDSDILISSIIRDGKLIIPKGHTLLKEHDILYVLAETKRIEEISEKINKKNGIET